MLGGGRKVEKELKKRFGGTLQPWAAYPRALHAADDAPGEGYGAQAPPPPREFWKKYDAVAGGELVSVWVLLNEQAAVKNAPKPPEGLWNPFAGAKRALQIWKTPATVSDPYHLTHVDSFVDDQHQEMFVVFKRCRPVAAVLEDLCAAELLLMLHDAASGLVHLHESHDVSHNDFSLESVYVHWPQGRRACAVGDLQYASVMDESLDLLVPRITAYRTGGRHPEENNTTQVTYAGSAVWVRDSWSVADVVARLLGPSGGPHDAGALAAVLGELEEWVHSARNATVRARVSSLPPDGSRDSLGAGLGSAVSPGGLNTSNPGGLQMLHQAVLPPPRPSVNALIDEPLFKSCGLVQFCAALDAAHLAPKTSYPLFAALPSLLPSLPYDVFCDVLFPMFVNPASYAALPGMFAFAPALLVGPHDGSSDGDASAAMRSALFQGAAAFAHMEPEGLLRSDERSELVEHITARLEHGAKSGAPVQAAVLRLVEPALAAVDEDMAERLLALCVAAVEQGSGDHDIVYYGCKAVTSCAKHLLMSVDGGDAEECDGALALIRDKVVPLLLEFVVSVRLSTKVRSSSLLALVQLAALDHRVVGATDAEGDAHPTPLISALQCTLLSGIDELCHHGLNCVIMAEAHLPLSVIAMEILPLLATVMLSPDDKTRDKCHQVTQQMLAALAAVQDEEAVDWSEPPLLKGCAAAQVPPAISKVDRKYLKRQEKAAGGGKGLARADTDTTGASMDFAVGHATTRQASYASASVTDGGGSSVSPPPGGCPGRTAYAGCVDSVLNRSAAVRVAGGRGRNLEPVVARVDNHHADDPPVGSGISGRAGGGKKKKKGKAARESKAAAELAAELASVPQQTPGLELFADMVVPEEQQQQQQFLFTAGAGGGGGSGGDAGGGGIDDFLNLSPRESNSGAGPPPLAAAALVAGKKKKKKRGAAGAHSDQQSPSPPPPAPTASSAGDLALFSFVTGDPSPTLSGITHDEAGGSGADAEAETMTMSPMAGIRQATSVFSAAGATTTTLGESAATLPPTTAGKKKKRKSRVVPPPVGTGVVAAGSPPVSGMSAVSADTTQDNNGSPASAFGFIDGGGGGLADATVDTLVRKESAASLVDINSLFGAADASATTTATGDASAAAPAKQPTTRKLKKRKSIPAQQRRDSQPGAPPARPGGSAFAFADAPPPALDSLLDELAPVDDSGAVVGVAANGRVSAATARRTASGDSRAGGPAGTADFDDAADAAVAVDSPGPAAASWRTMSAASGLSMSPAVSPRAKAKRKKKKSTATGASPADSLGTASPALSLGSQASTPAAAPPPPDVTPPPALVPGGRGGGGGADIDDLLAQYGDD